MLRIPTVIHEAAMEISFGGSVATEFATSSVVLKTVVHVMVGINVHVVKLVVVNGSVSGIHRQKPPRSLLLSVIPQRNGHHWLSLSTKAVRQIAIAETIKNALTVSKQTVPFVCQNRKI